MTRQLYDSVTNVGGSIFLYVSTIEQFSATRQLSIYGSVTYVGDSLYIPLYTVCNGVVHNMCCGKELKEYI